MRESLAEIPALTQGSYKLSPAIMDFRLAIHLTCILGSALSPHVGNTHRGLRKDGSGLMFTALHSEHSVKRQEFAGKNVLKSTYCTALHPILILTSSTNLELGR